MFIVLSLDIKGASVLGRKHNEGKGNTSIYKYITPINEVWCYVMTYAKKCVFEF